jgi:hypothetical protein
MSTVSPRIRSFVFEDDPAIRAVLMRGKDFEQRTEIGGL